jgi:hypothetical protein
VNPFLWLSTSALATVLFVPTGATIEPSGYATVLAAPHVPYSDEPPPEE